MSYLRQRHSSYLEVNLGFLSQNIREIQKLAGSAKLLPMVKGNAYGNGIGPVSRHLVTKCGIETLGVASLGEACYLATQCDPATGEPWLPKSFQGRIIVFSDTEIHNTELAGEWYQPKEDVKPEPRQVGIVPVLQSSADVAAFLALPANNSSTTSGAHKKGRRIPLWLKANTGMNRLGVTGEEELNTIARLLKEHHSSSSSNEDDSGANHIDHLLTHFSNADSPTETADRTEAQLVEFDRIKAKFEGEGLKIGETSTSNSAGITRGLHMNSENRWARCGLMMYGPSAVFHDQGVVTNDAASIEEKANLERIKPVWKGQQVCRLVTKALSVRLFKAGESIGYGVYPLPSCGGAGEESELAVDVSIVVTLPLGYADGFVKYYTGMTVTINGLHGNIHGGICMDTCFVSFPLSSLKRQLGTEKFASVNLEDPKTWPFQSNQEVHVWEWGDNRSLQRMANEVKTITYALMCCLTPRIERVYVDGEAEGQKK